MCILIICTKFVWNISQSKKKWARYEQDMIKNVYWSPCTVPIILVRFEWNLYFMDRFLKNSQIQNFMKIRRIGADLNSVGREMDRHDEANSCFSQFCKCAWTLKYFVKHFKHLSKGYNQPLETKIKSVCQLIVWKPPKIEVLPETRHTSGHCVHFMHLCTDGTQMNIIDLLHYAAEHTGTNFKKILRCILDNKNLLRFMSHGDKVRIL